MKRKILKLLEKKENLTLKAIAQELNRDKTTVKYYIDKLIAEDKISYAVRISHNKVYFLKTKTKEK